MLYMDVQRFVVARDPRGWLPRDTDGHTIEHWTCCALAPWTMLACTCEGAHWIGLRTGTISISLRTGTVDTVCPRTFEGIINIEIPQIEQTLIRYKSWI
jgi:hypothetical protein